MESAQTPKPSKRPPTFAATIRLILYVGIALTVISIASTYIQAYAGVPGAEFGFLIIIPMFFTLFIVSIFNIIVTTIELFKPPISRWTRISQYISLIIAAVIIAYGLYLIIGYFQLQASQQGV